MALKNSFLLKFILLWSFAVEAKMYPELMAKQSNENIRFISIDGRSTYYQKNSGSLHFSKNYKIIDVLTGPVGTHYTMFSTSARRKLVISKNENFHTFVSLRLKEKIFVLNFGEAVPREVGTGLNPQLHLNDDWLSYYDPYLKTINFEHTTNYALKFSIKINNRINPYFIPSIVMLDENTIYYTDLAENGNFGLVVFKRNFNQSEIVYKTLNPTTKIEIQKCRDNLIYSEFGIANSGEGTRIYMLPTSNPDFKTKTKVYNSELDDIGNITCDYNSSNFYFIKNVGNKVISAFDIAEVELPSKKINFITELKTASTLINMDGILITFDRGKYLIIKGNNDYKNVDSLKSITEKNETNQLDGSKK